MKNRGLAFVFVLALLLMLAGMAYAVTLTPQEITTSGIIITPVATIGTANEFANSGHEFLYITNGSGDTIYYTITVPAMVGGYNLEDISGTVAAGKTKLVGPFNPTYVNAADGNVDIAFNSTTTVTVAVLKLP